MSSEPSRTVETGLTTGLTTEFGSATTDVTQSGIHASADASMPPTVPDCDDPADCVDPTDCDDPTGCADPAGLEREIVQCAGLMHSSRHRLITALAAYDRSGHWAFSGARTCVHWVADRLGVSVGTAREWLRIGQALARLPLIDAAMAAGRLSYCAVRSLTRIAVDHPDHEEALVALAERTRPGDLSRAPSTCDSRPSTWGVSKPQSTPG